MSEFLSQKQPEFAQSYTFIGIHLGGITTTQISLDSVANVNEIMVGLLR